MRPSVRLGVCLLPSPVDPVFGCNVSGINKLIHKESILSLADYHG